MAHNEAYKLAESDIEAAKNSGSKKLSLKNKFLTALPPSIGKLKQLRELDLSENQLTTLPDSLSQLTQLQKLTLSSNQLAALPDSLGQLTQLTELDLSKNQLTALPDSLGQLTQLTELDLSKNQLTALPDSLGQLTQLQKLTLYGNQLTTLPDSLGQLTQLTYLNLANNPLTTLPDSLGQLTQLTYLGIYDNPLKVLPDWLARLTQLTKLVLTNNQLTALPNWLGLLTQLVELYLYDNQLTALPDSLGQLTKLRNLYLYNNPLTSLPSSLAQLEDLRKLEIDNHLLNPALQSAYAACKGENYQPLFAYLRSLEQNAEPLYEAKLVLVGEGNVGKTTLLKALKGRKTEDEGPRQGEPTTHGVEIDIHGLKLPHPAKDGIEIQLNAWDFGGQDVYRVTHQFFFSRRALYLLVWEPRRGVQQGQVEDWLNMIRLRVGDDARVIIVSTHCKTGERIARIDQPVLKEQYGEMIVGFYEVDSLVPDEQTGEQVGIAALKQVIAVEAAKLEQMGMLFNNDWKAARDELLAQAEPRLSYTAFAEICAQHSLSALDAETLAHLMHDLGYIVHYSEDERLREDVVLQPQWLTKAIGFVLEDRTTQESEGILPDNRLHTVWHDHNFKDEPRYDPALYPFFLRLMEKYDVSYRLPEGKASLVAQHVPQVRPALPWLPEQEPPHNLRRIAMICALEEDPPGLVPWMIVRTHDYSVEQGQHHLHWQKGMFLSHGTHGQAMLEQRGREFHVYAQGDWPQYFMTVLQHTLEKLITDNWPGLEGRYRFTIPCPGKQGGKPCQGRFNVNALREFLAKGAGVFPCQECFGMYSISELLMGFAERPVEVQLREIKEQLAGMDSRIANYFMATLRAIADEAKYGPRLFTFRERETGLAPKQLLMRPLEIQLWCEHEGHPHPVMEAGQGVYPIDQPREWLAQIAPYANFALGVLKTVAPMVVPALNLAGGAQFTENWKNQLDLSKAILDKLPEIKNLDRALEPGHMLSEPERSGLLALHRFLNEVDPTQDKLGLHRVPTYTGDYRWLCQEHYEAWQPNIPDVIPHD